MAREEFPLLPIEATAQGLGASVVGNAIWEATFFRYLPPLPTQSPHDISIELAVRGLPRIGSEKVFESSWAEAAASLGAPPAEPEPLEPSVPAGKVRIRTLRPPGRGHD